VTNSENGGKANRSVNSAQGFLSITQTIKT